jgi:hypothetical protein
MARLDARMARTQVKRTFIALVAAALLGSSAAAVAQPVDYSKVEISTNNLGNGVHLGIAVAGR